MFDFGFGEILVIGVVALIVMGPQDFTRSFRAMGKFTGRMRQMAREFTRAMDDAADQAGVSDIKKTIRSAADPVKSAGDAARRAASWGPETQKLSKERQEAKEKILAKSAEVAEARMAREKAAAAAAPEPSPATEAARAAPAAPPAAAKDAET